MRKATHTQEYFDRDLLLFHSHMDMYLVLTLLLRLQETSHSGSEIKKGYGICSQEKVESSRVLSILISTYHLILQRQPIVKNF